MAAAAAVQREAIGLIVVPVLALQVRLLMRRLLSAGAGRRQSVDVAVGAGLVRPRRVLLLVVRERLGVARNVRLRLARAVGQIAPTGRRLAVILGFLEAVLARARRLAFGTCVVRVRLSELF